jgi:hypothetical protein
VYVDIAINDLYKSSTWNARYSVNLPIRKGSIYLKGKKYIYVSMPFHFFLWEIFKLNIYLYIYIYISYEYIYIQEESYLKSIDHGFDIGMNVFL